MDRSNVLPGLQRRMQGDASGSSKKRYVVRKEFVGAAKPADTIVEVPGFLNPEWLVEIEVDAIAVDDASR